MPRLGQRPRRRDIDRARHGVFAFKFRDALVAAFEVGQLLSQRLASLDALAQRGTILPLQSLEQRKPVVHLLQPLRRGLDGV